MVKSNSYQLGLYEKAMPNSYSWIDKMEMVTRCGFDYLEISIDESDLRLARLTDFDEQKMIQNASQETGVSIRSMCLSGHRKYPLGSHDPLIRDKSLQIFKDAVDMCVRLGIRSIQLAGYDVYYETGDAQTESYFIQGLRTCIDYASKYQIVCGFESMETEFMNTVEKIMKTVLVVNSPYCMIYPDIGNLRNAQCNDEATFKDIYRGNGYYIAGHLKETIPNVFREVQFGTGYVNFEQSIQCLWDCGVRSYVCECWYEEGQDVERLLSHNNHFLRKAFEAVKES